MLDLLKTPIGETVVKTGADIVLRNMDFPGADELANRAMPQNPEGMQKAMEELPSNARAIVQALLAEKQQMQQAMQHLQLELKYKTQIEQGWMQTDLAKARMQTDTKAHDVVIRSHTELDKAHIAAQAGIVKAEIGAAGQLLNTNAEAKHNRAAAREMAEAGAKAEKGADSA
jgi:hypothetical protein